MKFKVTILWLIFPIFLQLSSQQIINRATIEGKFGKFILDFATKESDLSKKLLNYAQIANITTSNLKASNLPKNFTDFLFNLTINVQSIATLKNYRYIHFDFKNISDFNYAQFRISTCFTNVKFLESILEQIQRNETILHGHQIKLTTYFLENFRTLRKLPSKAKLVATLIRETLKIFRHFGDYEKTLRTHIANNQKLNSHLGNLIIKKIILPEANATLDPSIAKLMEIENQLVPVQQQILMLSKIALKKITTALKTVAASKSVQSGSFETPEKLMKKVQQNLLETTSMNDYSRLGWPKFPDISGDSSTVRLRASMCDDKNKNFGNSGNKAAKNFTKLQKSLAAFNSTILRSSARRVQAIAQEDLDAILVSLQKVVDSYGGYETKLGSAVVSVKEVKSAVVPVKKCPFREFFLDIFLDLLTFMISEWDQTATPIYDSDGFFVKYVCEVQDRVPIQTGRTECQKYGMDSYAITTKEELDQIKALTVKLHGYNGQEIGINGMLENGVWIVRNPDPKQLFPGAIPQNTVGTGYCMTVREWFGNLNIDSEPCDASHQLFCEWKL